MASRTERNAKYHGYLEIQTIRPVLHQIPFFISSSRTNVKETPRPVNPIPGGYDSERFISMKGKGLQKPRAKTRGAL